MKTKFDLIPTYKSYIRELERALSNLANYVEDTARDSFGHPDFTFEDSFKTEDPEGFKAWYEADLILQNRLQL